MPTTSTRDLRDEILNTANKHPLVERIQNRDRGAEACSWFADLLQVHERAVRRSWVAVCIEMKHILGNEFPIG